MSTINSSACVLRTYKLTENRWDIVGSLLHMCCNCCGIKLGAM